MGNNLQKLQSIDTLVGKTICEFTSKEGYNETYISMDGDTYAYTTNGFITLTTTEGTKYTIRSNGAQPQFTMNDKNPFDIIDIYSKEDESFVLFDADMKETKPVCEKGQRIRPFTVKDITRFDERLYTGIWRYLGCPDEDTEYRYGFKITDSEGNLYEICDASNIYTDDIKKLNIYSWFPNRIVS